MGTLQIGFTDISACALVLDKEWGQFEKFFGALKQKKWKDALKLLGDLMSQVGPAMSNCGVPEIGSMLQDTAKRLHADSIATDIGVAVQFLANGADISSDIEKVIEDIEAQNWASVGQDMGALSNWVTSKTECNSIVCRFAQGILKESNIALTNLKPCEDKLRAGETSFTEGVASWASGDKKSAVNSWGRGVNLAVEGLTSCGVTQQLAWIEQEAHVFGIGNFTGAHDMSELLVHGADFYEEVVGALQDFQRGDYRSAAGTFTIIMNKLSQWTKGHLCTSPVCYIVNGIMQYLSDLSADVGKCKSDFKLADSSFKDAFYNLRRNSHFGDQSFDGFSNHTRNITKGINDLGLGLKAVADGIGDCHLGSLEAVLVQLSAKLLRVPQIAWIQAFLKIMIDGVSIEKTLAEALQDFARRNWAGFGKSVMQLAKTLLKPVAEIIV